MQAKLEGCKRNKQVYGEKLVREMRAAGYNRTLFSVEKRFLK